jgi:hypothetical protein
MNIDSCARGDSGTSRGPSSTSWKGRVPVIRTTYKSLFECKHCAAEWSRVEFEEVEDFSRG